MHKITSPTSSQFITHDRSHQQFGPMTPTFEPLKVCLDDDSSIEDGEDMFDDDDFCFGDEDFQALLSRIPIKNPIRVSHSLLPGQSASIHLTDTVHSISDSFGKADFMDSAATSTTEMSSSSQSSSASLGNLTLLSQESATTLPSSTSPAMKAKSKRRVSLHNDVAVVPIPSHTEYPNMVRDRLWSSATELYQNAIRNSLEFAAEGWNWRTATDDDDMLVSPSGERIHPIHVMNCVHMHQGNVLSGHQEHDNCKVQANAQSPVCMDAEAIAS